MSEKVKMPKLEENMAKVKIKEGEGMCRYRVQFTFEIPKGKAMDPKSMTVPDMAISVQQMLQNFTRHQDKVTQLEPMYFDTQVPVIKDLTDVAAYGELLKQRAKDVQAYLKNHAEQLEAEKKEKEEILNQKENVKDTNI